MVRGAIYFGAENVHHSHFPPNNVDPTIGGGSREGRTCPPKIFSGGAPPKKKKSKEEEKFERKIKKRKNGKEKYHSNIGSKQMGQVSFRGSLEVVHPPPLNPKFFVPVPLNVELPPSLKPIISFTPP